MKGYQLAIMGCLAFAVSCGHAPPKPLAVYGNTTTLEVAPLLLAVEDYYPEAAPVQTGGIPRLIGEAGIPGFNTQGKADAATHAETQMLRYSVDRPDLRIILTLAEGHYRIVARKSDDVETVADLAGLKVGTVPNTSSEFFLRQELEAAGLDADAVEVVRVWPLSEMPGAMAAGEVDAITIWEPAMEQVVMSLGDDAAILPAASSYRELFNLNTTQAVLDDPVKRGQLVQLVAGIIRATRDLNTAPDRALTLVTSASGHDRTLVERAWPHQSYHANLPADLISIMATQEVWLAQRSGRLAREASQLAELVDETILTEALSLVGE